MSEEYKEELSLNNPMVSRLFESLIREIVQKELRKAQFNRMLPATVISVGANIASVKISIDDNTIPNLPNKTGQELEVGDEVYIECINGSISNMYIAIKK